MKPKKKNSKDGLYPRTEKLMPDSGPEDQVLVVIDMQDGFSASNDQRTISFVKQEILRAKQTGMAIVIVEFDPKEMGSTHREIMDLLIDYERCTTVSKDKDDGSEEILEACLDNGFWMEDFRICGVNSDACVLDTVTGLLERIPSCEITVVQDACNCSTGNDNDVWREDYPSLPVTVISAGHALQAA